MRLIELIATPAIAATLFALAVVAKPDAVRLVQGTQHVRARVINHVGTRDPSGKGKLNVQRPNNHRQGQFYKGDAVVALDGPCGRRAARSGQLTNL